MSSKRIVVIAALVLGAAVTVASAAVVRGQSEPSLAVAKAATAQFQDVDAAVAAGYGELRDAKKIACIQQAGYGGMGIHYVNSKLVGDAVLDPRRPEALVYQPQGSARHLVALEYIVFAKAWKKSAPPEMFGRTFDYVPKGNRYGLPPFWALHAWAWKANPTGQVMAWNPNVAC